MDGACMREANRVRVQELGAIATKAVTFTASGTVAKPIFKVTGSVEVLSLYGIVTTEIGSNHTAAHWRLNDQTATNVVISAAAGTTISSLPAGSLLVRIGLVASALSVVTAAAANIIDPIGATAPSFFMPFTITQKTGSIETDIEYVYSTNNTSLGAMTFYIGYVPLTPDASVQPY